ncbi:MAG TPA: alpha/beta fold hydrolase [Polyangia bacterium]|nr:alpha/beta fold hydrolase [Polyangia bacterium]
MRAAPFEIAATDGWRLRGEVRAPDAPLAVAIAGHAMMVDRRTLDRPRSNGFVSHLVSRGVAVVWPDLRGHGESGPRADEGGRWSYDDLVADVAPLIAFARREFPGLPCFAVGHSLFGHVTLAHLARFSSTAAPLDGLVMMACNVCNPEWRRRPFARAQKVALIEVMRLMARVAGRLPVRRLRLGTDDEPAPYIAQFAAWCRADDWRSLDGFSYWRALPSVTTPILGIVGAGDRLMSPPADARGVLSRIPNATFEIHGRSTGLPIDPGHMSLLLDARCRPTWNRIANFLVGK